jgi:5'-nucleotidase
VIANPRILITNDDGVDAPGLAVMLDIARTISDDVWVVAPDGNQSGAGHRLSFGQELSLIEVRPRIFAVSGSPADCVVAGYTHLLSDHAPDIVLSGVNAGQNLGDIVSCSGTAAGAREGAMQGALGIAMSQAVDYVVNREIDWSNSIAFGAQIVRSIIAEASGRDVYYNVNFPDGTPEDVSGVRVVPHQRFSRSPFRYYASRNDGFFFVAIPETPLPLDQSHDFHVLQHERAITVTPLSLLQSDMETVRRLDGKLTLDPPK